MIIYPNPTNSQVTVEGSENEWNDIIIYNLLGTDVTELTAKTIISDSKLSIDLSQLKPGIYFMKTKTTANKVYKE